MRRAPENEDANLAQSHSLLSKSVRQDDIGRHPDNDLDPQTVSRVFCFRQSAGRPGYRRLKSRAEGDDK